MKLIKPVVTPRITPVTAASLKQVVGGLSGKIRTGGGDLGSGTGTPQGGG